MIATKTELVNAVASYTHRNDLLSIIPQFIDIVTKRLGRELQSQANEKTIDFVMTQNPEFLPTDYAVIRKLVYPAAAGDVFITPMPMRYVSNISGQSSNGQPMYYNVTAKMITVLPTALSTYSLTYYAEPTALIADSDTNDVLLAYPDLYLYAALSEAFFYIQDGEMGQASKAKYKEELRAINLVNTQSQAGAVPAMRR